MTISKQLKETLGPMTDTNQEYAFLANNAVFGISRYKSGIVDDRTKDLIKQGQNLCSYLRRGQEMSKKEPEPSDQTIYSLRKADLAYWLIYEVLCDFLKKYHDNFKKTGNELVNEAEHEEAFLSDLLQHDRAPQASQQKVEQAQKFFASLGSIFVRLAHEGLRQREESERIRYV